MVRMVVPDVSRFVGRQRNDSRVLAIIRQEILPVDKFVQHIQGSAIPVHSAGSNMQPHLRKALASPSVKGQCDEVFGKSRLMSKCGESLPRPGGKLCKDKCRVMISLGVRRSSFPHTAWDVHQMGDNHGDGHPHGPPI